MTATQAAHEALHVHPVIRRLIAPDIDPREYCEILKLYLSFYATAEAVRVNYKTEPAFSLAPDIERLRCDLMADKILPAAVLPISTPKQALGMLYVLHGSRFGAMSIYRNLKTVLPTYQHAFFAQRPDKGLWHALLAHLETHQDKTAHVIDIVHGSVITFTALDAWMRRDMPL